MNLDPATLQLIECLAPGDWVSGTALAVQLGVSREAISRRMQKLEGLQLQVEKQAGRGYRLDHALELLDAAEIAKGLAPTLQAHQLAILREVDSTNRWLAEQSEVVLCLAEFQAGGRGRRGRHWHSPFGRNLYLSLKVRLPSWPEKLPALGLALGVALCQRLQAELAIPMQLKWPNDLYLNGRKCGGMLIEQRGEAQGDCELIIGLGLNVHMRTAEIDQHWTSLALQEHTVSRNALSVTLAQTLLHSCQNLSNAHLEAALQQYQHYDLYHGQQVQILNEQQRHCGRSLGIDNWGRLRLQTRHGVESFSVGDVSLRPA